MTVGEQFRWWGIGFAAFIVLLWFLSDAILPFVLGAALAYLTDPLADASSAPACRAFSRLLSSPPLRWELPFSHCF